MSSAVGVGVRVVTFRSESESPKIVRLHTSQPCRQVLAQMFYPPLIGGAVEDVINVRRSGGGGGEEKESSEVSHHRPGGGGHNICSLIAEQ